MIKKFKDKLLEALFKGEKEATTKEQKKIAEKAGTYRFCFKNRKPQDIWI